MCASRVLGDVAQLSRPLLSTNRNEEMTYKHPQVTGASLRVTPMFQNFFTGHKQRFIHTHVTRSPIIGIAKLSEVFINDSSPLSEGHRYILKPGVNLINEIVLVLVNKVVFV